MTINNDRQIAKDKFNSNTGCYLCGSNSTILDGSYWTCFQHIKIKGQEDKTVGEDSED